MITQETIKEFLHYDPETGIFTWEERDRKHFKSDRSHKRWNNRYAGQRAGTIDTNSLGYKRRKIGIFKKVHLEHVLAWVYMTGEQPPQQIDHLDRDATNNAWDNLRDGTNGINDKNKSRRIDNTSGITGVHWYKPYQKWRARGNLNGKSIHLGYFTSKDEAGKVVDEFNDTHGYTEGHGK